MDKTKEYDDLNIDQENEEELLDSDESLEQDSDETNVDDDEEKIKLRSEVKKLTEIIKRRKEREAKPASNDNAKQNFNNEQVLTREEAILVASGFSEEDLNYLNVVAKGTGLSIKEAKEHPLFETYLQKIEAEKKAKRAKLGASKGSSVHKPVSTAGMTPEQHKEYWATKLANK